MKDWMPKNPYECSVCDSEDCSGCGEFAYKSGCEDAAHNLLAEIEKHFIEPDAVKGWLLSISPEYWQQLKKEVGIDGK